MAKHETEFFCSKSWAKRRRKKSRKCDWTRCVASRDCCAGIQNLLQISKGLFTLRAETQNGRIQLLVLSLSLSLSLLVCLYARSLGLNIPRYICFSTYIRMYIVEHWSMSILLKYLCLIYRSLCADQRVFMYRPRYTFEWFNCASV